MSADHKYQRDLDRRKYKLRQLAGENGEAAFNRVRLIYQSIPGSTWIDAYDIVIREVQAAKALARKHASTSANTKTKTNNEEQK